MIFGVKLSIMLAGHFLVSSNAPCVPGLDSLKLSYVQTISYCGVYATRNPAKELILEFKNGELASWKADLGDLMKSGIFRARGCGIDYGDQRVCAVGLWADSAACFLDAIAVSHVPSHIIRNFGETSDIGLVYIDPYTARGARQIVVYRPRIGSVYSRQFSGFSNIFISRIENSLDFYMVNDKVSAFVESDIAKIRGQVGRLEAWIKNVPVAPASSAPIELEWRNMIH
jgi:hypothetical protein